MGSATSYRSNSSASTSALTRASDWTESSRGEHDEVPAERGRGATAWVVVGVIALSVFVCWLVAPRSHAAPLDTTSSQCLHPHPDRPGSELVGHTLNIDVLGVHRCAVDGGQDELDKGLVVRVDELSNDLVHWVTGHRTSHGATFSSLTGLQIGDLVEYDGRTYIVAEYRLVNRHAPVEVSTWMDSDTPSLVLQTSATSPYVHVWRAAEIEPLSL